MQSPSLSRVVLSGAFIFRHFTSREAKLQVVGLKDNVYFTNQKKREAKRTAYNDGRLPVDSTYSLTKLIFALSINFLQY